MLIRKKEDMKQETFEKRWNGTGQHHVVHLLNPDELNGKGRLFAENTLLPGASIGMHPHKGDTEVYYFLEGTGLYQTEDEDYEVHAGDLTLVEDGRSHGIKNIGLSPLKFIALILFTGEKTK